MLNVSKLSLSIPLEKFNRPLPDPKALKHELSQRGLLQPSESVFAATLPQLRIPWQAVPRKHDQDTSSQIHVDVEEAVSLPQDNSVDTDGLRVASFQATNLLRAKYDVDQDTCKIVFSGNLWLESLDGGETEGEEIISVVCKLIIHKEAQRFHNYLMNEAELYENNLKKLQGAEVPKFYGIFTGALPRCDAETSREQATCILLEKCGEVIPYSLKKHHIAIKLAYHELHKADVIHKEFNFRNILVDEQPGKATRVAIINFGLARPHGEGRCQGPKQLDQNFSLETRESMQWCTQLFELYSSIEKGILRSAS